ncbi:MAG TPA: quinone oxidoreductase [Rhodopseudomonas sp.]|uniref:quinone oxidoreductase family protein n=1 Tax=Rhodopseudomonas sp. TaxID=1078 RepID=UPI002EDAA540
MVDVIRLKAPGGPDNLGYVTIELPAPGDGDVRIRQTAIGVNFLDIYQRQGLYPLPQGIPGVEAVGVVAALGGNVTSLQVGDRIVYAGAPVGAYASERNLPAWRAVKLPATLADAQVAAVFLKAMTVQMLLTRIYPVGARDHVLVHSAAGGLGQLLVRRAAGLGAAVIGCVSSEPKAAVARAAGAAQVIVGRDADFAAAVAGFTAGRGVDVAYDGVGGATLAKTLACVRPFGVVVSIGQAAGPIPPLDVNELGPRRSLMLARPSVMGFMNDPDDYRAAAAAVLGLIVSGVFSAEATRYPLRDAARAQADLEAGRSSGSLLLVP